MAQMCWEDSVSESWITPSSIIGALPEGRTTVVISQGCHKRVTETVYFHATPIIVLKIDKNNSLTA